MSPKEIVTILAAFMGHTYKCTSEDLDYHHIQRMNDDGTPHQPGTQITSAWDLWNPHKDFGHLLPVLQKCFKEFPNLEIKFDNNGLSIHHNGGSNGAFYGGYRRSQLKEGEREVQRFAEELAVAIEWHNQTFYK